MIQAPDAPSTRPYLIRALYEWCTDNGLTPYVAVVVDDGVQVPREYVKDGEIVLNISFDATSSLQLGNDFIEFKARFAGKARDIMVPMGNVVAIYARETGQGMAFPRTAATRITSVPAQSGDASPAEEDIAASDGEKIVQLVPVEASSVPTDAADEPPKPSGPRPSLKRVK